MTVSLIGAATTSKEEGLWLIASSKNPVKSDDMNLTNIKVKITLLPISNTLHRHHSNVVTSKGWGRALPRSTAPHLHPGADSNNQGFSYIS